MMLLHYSKYPFEFDPARTYEDSHWFKPGGLWLSVDGEHSWREWCEGELWGLDGLEHVVEVTLKPNANVLLIDTVAKLEDFNKQFRKTDDHLEIRNITWDKVKSLYAGLIIAPYRWERRLDFMWYYGWDCASGVIWSLSAIAGVSPSERSSKT